MHIFLAFNSEKVRYQILKKVEYRVNFKNRARNKTRALSQITKGSLPYTNNYLPLIISHYNFLQGSDYIPSCKSSGYLYYSCIS
mgnify:CR=1 FL=1